MLQGQDVTIWERSGLDMVEEVELVAATTLLTILGSDHLLHISQPGQLQHLVCQRTQGYGGAGGGE